MEWDVAEDKYARPDMILEKHPGTFRVSLFMLIVLPDKHAHSEMSLLFGTISPGQSQMWLALLYHPEHGLLLVPLSSCRKSTEKPTWSEKKVHPSCYQSFFKDLNQTDPVPNLRTLKHTHLISSAFEMQAHVQKTQKALAKVAVAEDETAAVADKRAAVEDEKAVAPQKTDNTEGSGNAVIPAAGTGGGRRQGLRDRRTVVRPSELSEAKPDKLAAKLDTTSKHNKKAAKGGTVKPTAATGGDSNKPIAGKGRAASNGKGKGSGNGSDPKKNKPGGRNPWTEYVAANFASMKAQMVKEGTPSPSMAEVNARLKTDYGAMKMSKSALPAQPSATYDTAAAEAKIEEAREQRKQRKREKRKQKLDAERAARLVEEAEQAKLKTEALLAAAKVARKKARQEEKDARETATSVAHSPSRDHRSQPGPSGPAATPSPTLSVKNLKRTIHGLNRVLSLGPDAATLQQLGEAEYDLSERVRKCKKYGKW